MKPRWRVLYRYRILQVSRCGVPQALLREKAKDGRRADLKIGHYIMMKTELERAAGGADEVAEDGDVGAVDTDAAGIDGKA